MASLQGRPVEPASHLGPLLAKEGLRGLSRARNRSEQVVGGVVRDGGLCVTRVLSASGNADGTLSGGWAAEIDQARPACRARRWRQKWSAKTSL